MSERQHPLAALTKTRILEFVREPEALFWVFAFPILMAVVLGFAFRDRPPDPVPVGVVSGSVSREIADALAASGTVKPAGYATLADGLEALRTGKIALLVEQTDTLTYHLDATRPDARIARLEADAAIQRARGRVDPSPARESLVHEKGSRYIDFLLPGILGLNLMGTGHLGHRVLDRQRAPEEDAQAHGRDPHAQEPLPAGADALAVRLPRRRGRHHPGVRRPRLPGPDPRLARAARPRHRARRAVLRGPRPADLRARPHARGGQRVDEPDHGPDVAPVGRLLLLRALSEGRPAADPGSPADRAQQRPARRDAGRAQPHRRSARNSRSSSSGASCRSPWP